MAESWWLLLVGLVALVTLVCISWPAWGIGREARFARARKDFHAHREWLEVKFIRLAVARAAADAPRWEDCSFDDDVAYVRNRNTKELSAFVAVAMASNDLDSPSAGVSDGTRDSCVGTAIFRFDRDHWVTDGRAILNLNPAQAIRYYRNDLEVVDRELARQW